MADAQTLGPYRLERVLGTGSFATVWLAHDQVLDRRVAVKILADNWSRDNEVHRRFLSEARVLLTAESPRIVRGFHLGETPTGQPYLVMAWADRGTLGDRIEQRHREGRTFDVVEVVSIATEIAYALVDVHASGHLHRDVKPTNVLLRSSSTRRDIPGLAGDETVVLADFGLARGLDMTSLTLVAGSPGYVSPEQAAGLTQLDRRADLYSLGRIMLELLTGDPGGRATTMAAAAGERIDVPSVVSEAVANGVAEPPGRLVGLITRLVAEQPDDRPSTADEVAGDLVALRASMSVPGRKQPGRPLAPPTAPPAPDPGLGGAPQPTGTQLAAPVSRRNPLSSRTKLLGAGFAVVVAAVVAVVIALSGGGGGGGDGTTTTAPGTTSANPIVPVVSPAGSVESSTSVASTAGTTASSDPPGSSPVSEPSATTAAGGTPAAGTGRLDLSGLVPTFDSDDDENRSSANFVGTVAEALDALLADNPTWELVGDPPGDDTNERVTVEVAGPDGRATVRLTPKAETAVQDDVFITEVVVTYNPTTAD